MNDGFSTVILDVLDRMKKQDADLRGKGFADKVLSYPWGNSKKHVAASATADLAMLVNPSFATGLVAESMAAASTEDLVKLRSVLISVAALATRWAEAVDRVSAEEAK